MIRLEVNNGAFVGDYEYTDGMTGEDLITQFQTDNGKGNLRFHSIVLYDPSQNSSVDPAQELVDGRYYTATAWVQEIVDDSGEPISHVLRD